MTTRSPAALLVVVLAALVLVASACTSSDESEPADGEAAATDVGGDGTGDTGELDGGGVTDAETAAPEESGDDGSRTGETSESSEEAQTGETGAAGEQGPGPPGIIVSESAIGQILTDPDGYTLYLFTQDSKKKSACTGECAETFPPLVSEDGRLLVGPGVDKALLGSIKHPSAGVQVTYNGHPLYRFIDDQQPGDLVGHGVGNVWFAVSPAGQPLPVAEDG